MTVVINDLIGLALEAGAKCRIRYSTDVIVTDGGYRITNSRWAYPLHTFEFNLSPGYREDDAALDAFIDLFHAAGGAAGVFRFHYWRDLPAVGEALGTGNGSETEFQLYRNYTRDGVTRQRKITRPIEGSVTVYSNGTPVAAAVDYDTGVVIFTPAPPNGAALTADFENDIPVAFADDELEILGLTAHLDQPVSIVIEEQRE
jgi:uncharacterized protein (TIGR02217 family)